MENIKRFKKEFLSLLFLLCLFFFNFAGGGVVVQKVYGYVKDAKTQAGIYQAKVELKQNGSVVGSASTRADGYYLISTVYKGSFDVYALKQGYISQKKNIFVDTGKSVKADFSLLSQVDTTPPTVPLVQDNGSFTNSTAELTASWSSLDPESGISEYRFTINKSPEPLESLVWTSSGTFTSIKITGLNLIGGETYYFLVKAKNGSGLWSGIGVSDGIKVNRSPIINLIDPPSKSSFEEGAIIGLYVQASDLDSDTLQYQFSINSVVKRSWDFSAAYAWSAASGDLGIHNVKAEVRDDKGLVTEARTEIFIFRKPIQL